MIETSPFFVVKIKIDFTQSVSAFYDVQMFLQNLKYHASSIFGSELVPSFQNGANYPSLYTGMEVFLRIPLKLIETQGSYSSYQYDCITQLVYCGLIRNTTHIVDGKTFHPLKKDGSGLFMKVNFFMHFFESIDTQEKEVEMFLMQHKDDLSRFDFTPEKALSVEKYSNIKKASRTVVFSELSPHSFQKFNFFRIKFSFSNDIPCIVEFSEIYLEDRYLGSDHNVFPSGRLIFRERYMDKEEEDIFLDKTGLCPKKLFEKFRKLVLI